ncbi:BolA family protein [Limnohabitans sp.]|uniref:BolA family protein n=1 Tax=Limnohabitans sp. TaxID=1907725 RepID=UPI00286F77F6|nr:BolA family protein [Limnohabitans sp.]
MNITAQALTQRLQERLNPVFVEVLDESAAHAGHVGASDTGMGTHFRIRIQSPIFASQTRVATHRLVYDALQEYIDQGLHALAIEVIETP